MGSHSGKKLLQRFITKPKFALKSILRTEEAGENPQHLPTNLSIIRDETTGQLIVNPTEVIAQVQKLETKALSPDPALLPWALFPWLSHDSPIRKHTVPMKSRRINLAILKEALRRTPNHK